MDEGDKKVIKQSVKDVFYACVLASVAVLIAATITGFIFAIP